MTHYQHRCKHCGTKYTFQGSGEGCHESTNDRKYCPVCITAINEALAKLPKLSVQKWVPSPDISKKMAETILRVDHWRRKYISNNPDKFHESVRWNAMFVRVTMGGDCFEYNGREYFLSCDGKVTQKIWWNVEKNEAEESLENTGGRVQRRRYKFRPLRASKIAIEAMFDKVSDKIEKTVKKIKHKLRRKQDRWKMLPMNDSIYFIDRVYNGLNLEDHLVKTAKDEIEATQKEREKNASAAIEKFEDLLILESAKNFIQEAKEFKNEEK